MLSVFIGILLPQAIRLELHRLCYGVPDVNWTDLENFHLSLRYIGSVDGDLLLDVKEALAEVKQAPLSLSLQGISHMHKALSVGVKKSEPLVQLRTAIDLALHPFAFPHQRFSPHVTIGKYTQVNEAKLAAYLEGAAFFETSPFQVDAFSLLSTHFTSKRKFYKEEERYFLA